MLVVLIVEGIDKVIEDYNEDVWNYGRELYFWFMNIIICFCSFCRNLIVEWTCCG